AMTDAAAHRLRSNAAINKLHPADRPVHGWYRFVLSFPPHLVREYLRRFDIGDGDRVLDPFCGTGTVLVECKKRGIASVGIEANPLPAFAAAVKVDWRPDPDGLVQHAERVAAAVSAELAAQGCDDDPPTKVQANGHRPLRTLPPERHALLLADSISPLALHKT